mmetsp:Transcript_66572/g.157841  ORF Transcript_66572/g.157841 Transcript_66572/m.157841 type:complete len:329 (+) Transcript_66572:417-1403(+)
MRGLYAAPITRVTRKPLAARRRVSSSGVTNFAQSCVPFGTRPRMFSARRTPRPYERCVRLIVVMHSPPPSSTREQSCETISGTSETCSMTSLQTTTVYVSPSSRSWAAVAARYARWYLPPASPIRPPFSACASATRMFSGEASTPVTCAPILQSSSESMPPPQPMSTTRTPASADPAAPGGGATTCCLLIDARKSTRRRLKEWSGFCAPLASHHPSPIAPNLSTSSWSTVPALLLPPSPLPAPPDASLRWICDVPADHDTAAWEEAWGEDRWCLGVPAAAAVGMRDCRSEAGAGARRWAGELDTNPFRSAVPRLRKAMDRTGESLPSD